MEENSPNIAFEQITVVEDPGWGVGWAVFAYIGFIVIQLASGTLIGIFYSIFCMIEGRNIPMKVSDYPVILIGVMIILSQILSIVWVFYLVRVVHRLPFRRAISWDGGRAIAEWKPVVTGFALVLLNAGFSAWFPPSKDLKVPLEEFTRSTEGLVIFSFVAVFIAPISEELTFRGYIFAPLQKRMGSVATIAVTAILFMTPHLWQLGEYRRGVIFIGLLGVATGALRVYTGGVRAGVICHLIYNLCAVIMEAMSRIAPNS